MDKKKIQIAIIVVCMLVTGGVLYWGFFSSSTPEIAAPDGIAPINTDVDSVVDVAPVSAGAGSVGDIPTSEAEIQYSAPPIFPASATLDLSIFESAKFRALQDYTPLSVTPEEIGKENPFQDYQ